MKSVRPEVGPAGISPAEPSPATLDIPRGFPDLFWPLVVGFFHGWNRETTLTPLTTEKLVRLALPKGRMQDNIFKLLGDAGIQVRIGSRGYRPTISIPNYETKILKPQNIVEMLDLGSRDVGFAGADWVEELNANLVEILDTELDPVRIVAASPEEFLDGQTLKQGRSYIVASEYTVLTKKWIARTHLDATFVRSYGATEVFPPEDADIIVDNTATGSTLAANGLTIVDTLMRSSTRLYANPRAMEDPFKREEIEKLCLLLKSVLEARQRVMVEVNVSAERLEDVVAVLPSMGEPTISKLHGDLGFAVKAAVPRKVLPLIIPQIKARGGTDIVVYSLSQIIP